MLILPESLLIKLIRSLEVVTSEKQIQMESVVLFGL